MTQRVDTIPAIKTLELAAFIRDHPVTVVYARRWPGEFDNNVRSQLLESAIARAPRSGHLIDVAPHTRVARSSGRPALIFK